MSGEPPDESEKEGRVAPLLGSPERFRPEPAAPILDPDPDPASDPGRRTVFGEFLNDLAHTLASRGDHEVDALLERSEHERRLALRDRPELSAPEVAAELLARCRTSWPDDPAGALDAARLALKALTEEEPGARSSGRSLLPFCREHLAAAERIERRAREIGGPRREARRLPPSLDTDEADDAVYPLGMPTRFEVAEDAVAVEVEAALDDLRDAGLRRGRPLEAALAALDRGRLALASGGPAALAEWSRAEAERFADPALPPVPLAALGRLAAAASDATDEPALFELIRRLSRLLLSAAAGDPD